MKYKIPKGSVQETLVIPLYGRKLAMDLYPDLFADHDCQRIFSQIEYEFPNGGGLRNRVGGIMGATRQFDMAERFRGGKPVFDATKRQRAEEYAETWLKPAEMGNVGVYFSVEDKGELLAWSDRFASVVRKGCMTGYRPLDKWYGLLANTIFRIGDKCKMCQVIEIAFKV